MFVKFWHIVPKLWGQCLFSLTYCFETALHELILNLAIKFTFTSYLKYTIKHAYNLNGFRDDGLESGEKFDYFNN